MTPITHLKPRRKITGMSAVLLPFLSATEVDWSSFEQHVARTCDAGLIPAVNMDTGYVNLLDESTRLEVLQRTQRVTAGRMFVAGAFVKDAPGAAFDSATYASRMHQIQSHGGTPVIFQSYGLTQQSDDAIIDSYRTLARECDRFVGFELGTMFAPFGRIYSETVYRGLMSIPQCLGAKHSSLERSLEWDRLRWRDEVRLDFLVLTGNDLAIDMVVYGSDYLLGLSSFAPDLFARRDAMWQSGDSDFYQLNDVLQYLGFFAFRNPVPAYKHSAAMFLQRRGWIKTSLTHPQSPERPASDGPILDEILKMLSRWL
ncbi:MAG: dihydrodipicolinate synthase family protein [Planctomycetaceae bacterium]|nr:dihydrodipicolinate synthase family protein [Planctomycetaceae bacterium]